MAKDPVVKIYTIAVDGFDDAKFEAVTPSKARAAAFRQLRDIGYRMTFKEFLDRCSVLHHGPARRVTC